MIVYQATKSQFCTDVLDDVIEERIVEQFAQKLKRKVARAEVTAYKNSMAYMDRVINHSDIPDDCGVAIEYHLPQSSKRIDFILTGADSKDVGHIIIVELKQWSEATRSDKDGIVNTYVGGRVGEHTHPSYQAWSYASLLENFNQNVTKDNIQLKPCAYLHNYVEDDVMTHDHYKDYLVKAPIFLKGDASKLRAFIKQYVTKGDKGELLYRIDSSKVKPTKMLSDNVTSMLKGNQEFVLIDDQKMVLEQGISIAVRASEKRKKVLIVKGGPGTGKSVVAINLLAKLVGKGLMTRYVSKNAAPRKVYENKLIGTRKKSEIAGLFGGSGDFVNTPANLFDCLVVDEAHRLNSFSGLYRNLGENQIKEIINASKCSIVFLDEDQRVTLDDIGSLEEIRKWAKIADAEIVEMSLESQFRCNGSDGYLAWLDNTLQIRQTANKTLEGINYDFRVLSSPIEVWDLIYERNKINNKSRMVAGYCWDWKSKSNPEAYDVIINKYDFKMQWNLTDDGSLWIIGENSINEIGCIHTCQGLELDYVGVIIGDDLVVRSNEVVVHPEARSKSDMTIRGYKKLLAMDVKSASAKLEAIIKNTYRTLMTRGMKGCYVFCQDQETEEYFRFASGSGATA